MRTRRRSQGGFTLIELVVSLGISSLLAIMLLSIFTKMTVAYRRQGQVVTVQQVLAAARDALESDARQAGLGMAQGFTLASDQGAFRHPAIAIENHSDGPDEVTFFYGDPTQEALVVGGTATALVVDDATGFAAGDVVVLSTPDTSSANGAIANGDANIAQFTACVVQIASISGPNLTLSTSAPWGIAGNTHCSQPAANVTMVFALVAHAWRIDPDRPDLGALQVDRTGGLGAQPSYADEAYGVTDLQVATYFYDGDGTDTDDPDADPARDWHSGDTQTTLTAPVAVAAQLPQPLMMSMSLVARTTGTVDGNGTRQTPELRDAAHVDHNTLGDRAAITLPSATDPALRGNHTYRYLTFQVDLRNLGVGK